MLLEPLPVADERLHRNRCRELHVLSGLVIGETELSQRIRDIRGIPGGAKEHTGGHLVLPELHRLPENDYRFASRSQMRRGGEAIGPGTDHDHFYSWRRHRIPTPLL